MKEVFFYTTDYPCRWTSGPNIHTYDPKVTKTIESLEEAKEYAEQMYAGPPGTEYWCKTSYGVMYEFDPEES